MKTKLSQEKHASKDMAEHHDQIQAFFDRLASLKDHLQRKLEAAANLKATGAPITADQLLEAMFHHVFNTHYLEHWPPLKPSKWSGKAKVPDDITTYQAII